MLIETEATIGIMRDYLIMAVLKLIMVQRPFLKWKIGKYDI